VNSPLSNNAFPVSPQGPPVPRSNHIVAGQADVVPQSPPTSAVVQNIRRGEPAPPTLEHAQLADRADHADSFFFCLTSEARGCVARCQTRSGPSRLRLATATDDNRSRSHNTRKSPTQTREEPEKNQTKTMTANRGLVARAHRQSTTAALGMTSHESRVPRSSCALIATITVLNDMRTAPAAGLNTMPWPRSTPAASGMATML
jgi:hypothetical protein